MTGLDTAKSPAASAGPADAALPRLLTVGHSNRELNEFIELLAGTSSEVIVDVRKLPGSTKNPWFNADTLESDLAEVGIELRRLEGLAGRRPVSRTVPFTVNAWWQNRSFHNYADHCLSSAFRTDLETLIGWSTEARCAIMCSEAVWWRCHRRIIADQLLARDLPVAHILGEGHIDRAKLSEGARIEADGTLTYPADS